jgi:hypothetical protein
MHHRGVAHLGSARGARARVARFACVVPVVAAAALLACSDAPVSWNDTRVSRAMPYEVVNAEGVVLPDTNAVLAARLPRPGAGVCPYSMVISRAGARVYAAWWHARPDSGANLLAAHTDDRGRTWSAPAAVDTTDQGTTGCRRSPPAIAADPASGYVHLVYGMLAREGPGLFYAHSMDSGATFHAPVPIFYGERLGLADVAADGDHVAVAFEDPNSRTPRIGLAISRTMGHIFQPGDRVLPVSDENGVSTRPRVAVRGKRIAVAWIRRAGSDSGAAVLAIRTGVLR